jgi:hypothetical protein
MSMGTTIFLAAGIADVAGFVFHRSTVIVRWCHFTEPMISGRVRLGRQANAHGTEARSGLARMDLLESVLAGIVEA